MIRALALVIRLAAVVAIVTSAPGCTSIDTESTQQDTFSQSSHFRIAYKTRGAGAPPAADSNGDSVPDYVDWAAEAGEHALSVLLAQGWPRPPAYDDNRVYSSGSTYDIEIRRLHYEGYTEPVSWLGDNPHTAAVEDDVWLARMAITNDFVALGYPSQKEYLQLFVAHEFVHLAIAGVNWGSSGVLDCAHEWTAAWMESVIYPDIYNNRDYIKYYFDNPDIGIIDGHLSNFDACYGMWLFPHFVVEGTGPFFGARVMPDFWRAAGIANMTTGADVHAALDQALMGSLAEVFAAFTVAVAGTVLAPEHAMPAEYAWSGGLDNGPEGFEFPALSVEATLDCGARARWHSSQQGDGGLPALAADYFEITGASSCRIRAQGTDPGLYARALIARAGQPLVEVRELEAGDWLEPGADVERMILVVGNRGAAPAMSYAVQMAAPNPEPGS